MPAPSCGRCARRIGLTQKDFAAKLGVSLPYLNQMENNNRPVSTSVVLGLAREFGLDVTELGSGDTERLVSDMREAIADPIFAETAPPLSDLRLAASNAPALARAFLDLHRAYRQTHERLASLDEALGQDGRTLQSPWEEVRDFFHYCDNYIDAVDRAAERFASQAEGDLVAHTEAVLGRMGITLRMAAGAGVRNYDREARILTLSPRAAPETQRFQLLHQYALLGQAQLLDATLDLARFQTDTAREIARIGMANYFRGRGPDALHPLRRGRARDAPRSRTAVDPLSAPRSSRWPTALFHPAAPRRQRACPSSSRASIRRERSLKRHSATRLQFARYGSACPLWNVHSAFETPGRFLRQLAETPDGARYVILARDVSKTGGAWGALRRGASRSRWAARSPMHRSSLCRGLALAPRRHRSRRLGLSCRICERGPIALTAPCAAERRRRSLTRPPWHAALRPRGLGCRLFGLADYAFSTRTGGPGHMAMHATRTLAADRAAVWAALNDAEVLKACIPGCGSVDRQPGRGVSKPWSSRRSDRSRPPSRATSPCRTWSRVKATRSRARARAAWRASPRAARR